MLFFSNKDFFFFKYFLKIQEQYSYLDMNFMRDIRCKTSIPILQDSCVNASGFQYDLSIEMQNTFFDEYQQSNFDIISKNSFGINLIKDMHYSGKTFCIKHLIDHFIYITIKKILRWVPTSATLSNCHPMPYCIWALEASYFRPLLCFLINQLDPPEASSSKYIYHWQEIHVDSNVAHNHLF
jgi:hypothetical protein